MKQQLGIIAYTMALIAAVTLLYSAAIQENRLIDRHFKLREIELDGDDKVPKFDTSDDGAPFDR